MLLFIMAGAYAVVPAGYYDSADGVSGAALKTSMYNIIKDHDVLTYSDLWKAFEKTDSRPDGKVWDVYSNITNYSFTADRDQGSGVTSENQLFNREHSFPKSWFGGDVSPMYTDLFHLYPADKWVNAKRGNIPFGNVATITGKSANSYCIWGTSNESGVSLNVFEPADELKGDFARTYFYMATRYEDQIASWKVNANTEMLDGTSYPALSSWAKKVLLEWSRQDPVSQKEIARNDSIYKLYQHNRNPYIDFKSLAEYVWGDSVSYEFHPAKYLPVACRKVNNDCSTVYSSGETVFIKSAPGKVIEVFGLDGSLLYRKILQSDEIQINLRSGSLYLIKIGTEIKKIVL
jgi:endonuclease I